MEQEQLQEKKYDDNFVRKKEIYLNEKQNSSMNFLTQKDYLLKDKMSKYDNKLKNLPDPTKDKVKQNKLNMFLK